MGVWGVDGVAGWGEGAKPSYMYTPDNTSRAAVYIFNSQIIGQLGTKVGHHWTPLDTIGQLQGSHYLLMQMQILFMKRSACNTVFTSASN